MHNQANRIKAQILDSLRKTLGTLTEAFPQRERKGKADDIGQRLIMKARQRGTSAL